MADAKAPIDVVGTGSFIPDVWHETYATADIVEYDGVPMVKIGREFLLRPAGPPTRPGNHGGPHERIVRAVWRLAGAGMMIFRLAPKTMFLTRLAASNDADARKRVCPALCP